MANINNSGISADSARNNYVIPPDAPVLPTLASQCMCELRVSENGQAMVMFNKDTPEGIHWVEYDMDLALLTFVTWSGKVMGLGMKIHPPFRPYLSQAEEIMMVFTNENGTDVNSMYPADLVVRHTGI